MDESKAYGYIYETTNIINGKKYIGQHRGKFTSSYKGSGKKLCLAFNKYGIENFDVKLIELCDTPEDLDKREIYWIAKYRKDFGESLLYNMADGGRVNRSMSGERNPMHHSNYIFTKEHRERLSRANKGKQSWIKGKHWSEEQRKRLSYAAKHRKKFNSIAGKISIYKNNKVKYIFPNKLDEYLKLGWTKGNPKNAIWQRNQSESRKNLYKVELNSVEIIIRRKK